VGAVEGEAPRRYEFIADDQHWKRVAAAIWTYQFRRIGPPVLAWLVFAVAAVWIGTAARQPLVILGGSIGVVAGITPLVSLLVTRWSVRRASQAWKKTWTEFGDETFTVGSSDSTSTLKYGLYRYRATWHGFVVLSPAHAPRRRLFFPEKLLPPEIRDRFGGAS